MNNTLDISADINIKYSHFIGQFNSLKSTYCCLFYRYIFIGNTVKMDFTNGVHNGINRLLHRMLHCNNIIVNQCIIHASYDPHTIIGYKLSFNISKFGYNLDDLCLRYNSPVTLAAEKISQIDCKHTLCLARSKQVSIEGFSDEELNDRINCIAVD